MLYKLIAFIFCGIIMTSCSSGGAPEAVKTAIQKRLGEYSYQIPGGWNIVSAEKASQPQNTLITVGAEEGWCVVTEPPVSRDNLNNFFVYRIGSDWQVLDEYTSPLQAVFPRLGCSNYRS